MPGAVSSEKGAEHSPYLSSPPDQKSTDANGALRAAIVAAIEAGDLERAQALIDILRGAQRAPGAPLRVLQGGKGPGAGS